MKKILIDADTGVDDAIAILYALRQPDVRVLGITTSRGNVPAAIAAHNSLCLVELAQPGYPVPVAVGADSALAGEVLECPVSIHGENGLGNATLPPPAASPVEQGAADFIVATAKAHPGEVTLVTLGRMTNLARALKKEPELPRLFDKVVAMGGTVSAPGNAGPHAEANIAGDPEAADRVCMAGFPLCLVGLDVTMSTRLRPSALEQVRPGGRLQGEMLAFVQTMLQLYADFYHRQEGFEDEIPLHDPLAMLIALCPELGKYRSWPARVETGGQFCRGMVVADRRAHPFAAPAVQFCMQVDAAAAVRQLLTMFD